MTVLSLSVFPSGPVDHGESDRVPAQSGGGEVHGGGRGPVLPTPPHRELQAAVERQSGGRLLHRQTQRWDSSGICHVFSILRHSLWYFRVPEKP